MVEIKCIRAKKRSGHGLFCRARMLASQKKCVIVKASALKKESNSQHPHREDAYESRRQNKRH